MIATIHQPDFMPWLGFFKKLTKVDTWIVLDHVTNNPRDAAFWGRRVKILVNRKPFWLSIPLKKPEEPSRISIPIKEMKIDRSNQMKYENQLKTITQSYCKAPCFSEILPAIQEYYSNYCESLAEKNLLFIQRIFEGLKMKLQIVKSSELGTTTSSTAMLVELLKTVGADCYICGDGAQGYQKDSLFMENKILLQYNNFTHPKYPQSGSREFVPGLSIIDAIANIGFKQTNLVLKN